MRNVEALFGNSGLNLRGLFAGSILSLYVIVIGRSVLSCSAPKLQTRRSRRNYLGEKLSCILPLKFISAVVIHYLLFIYLFSPKAYLERRALRLGITHLFLLSTRTMQWFEERGFEPADPSVLPSSRKYDASRGSKVYIKVRGQSFLLHIHHILFKVLCGFIIPIKFY